MDELREAKKCPRCGWRYALKLDGHGPYWITCEFCWLEGPAGATKEDAVNFWNEMEYESVKY